MTDQRRLFFALWPDGKIREQCLQLAAQQPQAKARPVARENLHATLIFLGDQPAAALPVIRRVASHIQMDAFQLILDHMEIWKRSQVLGLCPSQIPESLTRLHEALKQGLDEAGIVTETRAYRPHVTLARKVKQKIALADIVPIEWSVNTFVLVESVFKKAGVHYQVFDRWLLG